MSHVWRPRYMQGGPDLSRCRAAVHDGGRSVSFHQCNRKAMVYRKQAEGDVGFCSQHDPEAVEARRKKEEKGWRIAAEARKRREQARTERNAATSACVEAVRQVAAGHNDARALAQAAVARLDAAIAMETGTAIDSEAGVVARP